MRLILIYEIEGDEESPSYDILLPFEADSPERAYYELCELALNNRDALISFYGHLIGSWGLLHKEYCDEEDYKFTMNDSVRIVTVDEWFNKNGDC